MPKARLQQAFQSTDYLSKPQNAQHSLKNPQCSYDDNTYQSKVFYIRFREEQFSLGEVIQFFSFQPYSSPLNAKDVDLTLELWFMERSDIEIRQKQPINKITDVSQFKLVSSRQLKFNPHDTFEHFVLMFDNCFTCSLQINIISIQKQIEHNNLVSEGKQEQQKLMVHKSRLAELQQSYDKLRGLHSELIERLTKTVISEVHAGVTVSFGPLRQEFQNEMPRYDPICYKPMNAERSPQHDRRQAIKLTTKDGSILEQSISSEESAREKRARVVHTPILQQSKMLHTSLTRISEQSKQPQINNQKNHYDQKSWRSRQQSNAIPSKIINSEQHNHSPNNPQRQLQKQFIRPQTTMATANPMSHQPYLTNQVTTKLAQQQQSPMSKRTTPSEAIFKPGNHVRPNTSLGMSPSTVKQLSNMQYVFKPNTTLSENPKKPGQSKKQAKTKVISVSAVPPIQYHKPNTSTSRVSKMSDEISSSSSNSADAMSNNISVQIATRQIKSLINMQLPDQKGIGSKDEDIPAWELQGPYKIRQELLNRNNITHKKPGSKHNLGYEMAVVHSLAIRATKLILELWHYIHKILQKALDKVNQYLRLKYLKQQSEMATRIIVSLEEEEDKPKRNMSIRESGVRKRRRNEIPLNETGQDSKMILLKQDSVHLRSKSSNYTKDALTPSRIERSQLLARNHRIDVSAQPRMENIQTESRLIDPPRIFFAEPDKRIKSSKEPIIIEEVYYDEEQMFTELLRQENLYSANQEYNSTVHLFVFVHGFQATGNDMQLFKNHLQTLLPNSMFLISRCNEGTTDSSIERLGLNLAEELKNYVVQYLIGTQFIQLKKPMSSYFQKLTFIGHSLGGIIIRESLKHLNMFKEQMHGFVSLGSPHLGFLYNSSSIVDAGMWFIQNWTKSMSLKQLSMTDANDFKDSFLFKLSELGGMQYFKFVILVGSYQDSYAPYDSARIQICSQALSSKENNQRQQTYLKMAENILQSLNCSILYRLDVNFKIDDNTLASMIGRTAHIQMIECEPLIVALIYKYSNVFSA